MSDPIARLNGALEARYTVERELGEGGMATVYLALDERHDRRVAIKVLRPELAAVLGAERFLAEIKTTANLQHPNILPLHDSGEADGLLFYVMPYVEGETLRDRLDRQHELPVEEAVDLAVGIAEGLQYAHDHGVIHRDIKPANVLLQAGKPVISDFGIALAVGVAGGGRMTETGLSLGTPHYMSPEQATGDVTVGPATDIYALGCVLYEMLAGEPPFTGTSPQAVLGRIVTGEAEPLSARRKSVPANVDAAVARALERLPADRFAGAADLVGALRDPAFRHGEAAASGAGAGVRSRWPAVAGWATAAVMAIALVLQASRSGPASPATTFSIPAPGEADIATVSHQGLAVSPDGRTILFGDWGSTGLLFRRDLDELEATPIPGTENAFAPFFSPDGEWIGYLDQAEDVLKKVRLDGSDLQVLAELPPASRSAGWCPDGTIVAHSSRLGGLLRVPEAGGELVPIPLEDGPRPLWLGVLPECNAVLAAGPVGDDESTVTALRLDTGERLPLFPGRHPRFVPPDRIVYWHKNSLWAAPFDPQELVAIGEHTEIVQGVVSDQNGFTRFAVGGDLLVYQAGQAVNRNGGMPVWVDREGNEEPLPLPEGTYRWPRISPDGTRLLLRRLEAGNWDLWIYDFTTGVLRQLTFDPANDRSAVWTPPGDRVVFSSERGGSEGLFWRRADGSDDIERLTTAPEPHLHSWTRDGRLVFSQLVPDRGADLFVLSLDDRTPVPLLGEAYSEVNAAVSPDGRWLAYETRQLGYPGVFVKSMPDLAGERRVSTLDLGRLLSFNMEPTEGRGPVWSRDGDEVFYTNQSAMVSVPVLDRESLVLGPPEFLFSGPYFGSPTVGPHFDVGEDGRFLMLRIMEDVANELIVVQNWR